MRDALGLNPGAGGNPLVFLMGRDVPRSGARLLVGVHISKGGGQESCGWSPSALCLIPDSLVEGHPLELWEAEYCCCWAPTGKNRHKCAPG